MYNFLSILVNNCLPGYSDDGDATLPREEVMGACGSGGGEVKGTCLPQQGLERQGHSHVALGGTHLVKLAPMLQ